MEPILIWFKEILPSNLWIVQVFVVVFGVVVINFIQRRMLNRLHDKLKLTPNTWDDAIVNALGKPITLFIWIVGIAFAAEIVRKESDAVMLLFSRRLNPCAILALSSPLSGFCCG